MSTSPRRRRGSGSLGQLKGRLWAVIEYSTRLVEDEERSPVLRLKASTALVQAALAYARLVESSDHETRIARLEAERNSHP
jgi:hypothetical protein